MSTDPIDLIDVTDMCRDLGMTERQVRRALRQAVSAGLLAVDAVTATSVVLRGTFPDESPSQAALEEA